MSSPKPPYKPLDVATFGNSPACVALTDMLNRIENQSLTRKTVISLQTFYRGLNEIMKMDSPYREIMLKLFHDHTLELARADLFPKFDEHEINNSYFQNILHQKKRAALRDGELLEKLRGECRDHSEMLNEIRELRKETLKRFRKR